MSINKNKTIMDNNINNMIAMSMPKGCRFRIEYEKLPLVVTFTPAD